MNNLGIALIWLALQVTLLALAGLGLTKFAARRGPGAGASTALATLLATALLAVVAACPLPSWWTWDPGPAASTAAHAANGHTDAGSPATTPMEKDESPSGGGVGVTGLLSALKDLINVHHEAGSLHASFWSWPATVAAIAAAGVFLGLLRLLLGILAIRRGLRNSRPVTDSALLSLVEELRATLRVKRRVKVLAWSNLNTAATVGWRKPVLLLPADWRDWDSEQRRAVIAHELVHVARSDFAGALLGQLSLVLHFWHPLVHLLVRQFQIQQELATDAVAASVVGGRTGYLRALAALALRSTGRAHGWPAPALLSPKGTLLRRVEMLRFPERVPGRPVSRMGRRLTLGAICGLTLFVSALRMPVQRTLADSPAETASSTPAQVTPFDLSLLGLDNDKESVGVYGIRPAAIFNRPSTEPWRRDINRFIFDELGKHVKVPDLGLHVQDIEQVMGRVYVRGENKPGKRSLMFSVNVLQTARSMDWDTLRDKCGLKPKQHQWKGVTYVSIPIPPGLAAIIGPTGDACFWAPDAHTLIFDGEENIKALIEVKAGERKTALPDYAHAWDRLSRGLFVVAVDKNSPWLNKIVPMTPEELKELESKPGYDLWKHGLDFWKNTTRIVVGCAGSDDFRVQLWASAETPGQADGMARSIKSALAEGKKLVEMEKDGFPNPNAADTAFDGFMENLLSHTTIRRDGNAVTVQADATSGFNALLSALAKGGQKGD